MRIASPCTLALTLGAALTLALASPARAGTDVGVVVTGSTWMQPQVVSQLESWLTRHGHVLVQTPLPPEAINALNDCVVSGDQSCARSIVEQRARSSSIIYARVESRSNGSDTPDLTLTTYWLDKGHDAVAERKTCQRCTDQLLHTTADDILKKLVGGGDLGHVVLKSAPPGARISIDGQPTGITPLDWDLPPGKHAIRMDTPGRAAQSRDVDVIGNQSTLVVLTLPPLADTGEQSEGPSRVLPWTLLGVGGAAVVAGAALIVFSPSESPDKHFYYKTWPAGIGVAAGGAAAAAVGAYLLWFRTPSTSSTPVAAVTGDSAYVGWLGRF